MADMDRCLLGKEKAPISGRFFMAGVLGVFVKSFYCSASKTSWICVAAELDTTVSATLMIMGVATSNIRIPFVSGIVFSMI